MFWEFKLETEKRQKEKTQEIKKEVTLFIDDPNNLNSDVKIEYLNPEIETVDLPSNVDLEIKDEVDEGTILGFIDEAKVEYSIDDSSDEISNENSEESSLLKSDSEETEGKNFIDNQKETEEGVVRTVINNVEFIARKPGCLVMVEKKKAQPEAIRNNQKPENWIRIRQRTARARGEEYISRQGKVIRARKLQPPCDSKCRFNCAEKLTEADRQKSFDTYWQLADFIKQRKYLFEHSKAEPVARRRGKKEHGIKRKFSLKFFLDIYRLDGSVKEQIKVCAKMFVNTLDICQNVIRTLHKKIITIGKVEDLRGQNRRKPSPGHLCAIAHVKNFPFFHIEKPMPLTQLYKLYEQECREKHIEPIREHTYRKIFADNNECDFLKQDRMICYVCDKFYKLSEQEQVTKRVMYEQHIRSNEKCMQRARWRMSGRRKAERRRIMREQQKAQENQMIEDHQSSFESEINFI